MDKIFWTGVLCLFLAGCAGPGPVKRFSESREFFGSVVRVDVCHAPGRKEALERAVSEIWARFADIHSRLSVYDPASDLNRVNHSFPAAVTVGADTWAIIREAVYYNRLSAGEFDITVYPLLKLWKDSEKSGVLPTAGQVRLIQQGMGSDKFELLGNNQIRLLNPATQLTIDSIADGYAADEAARILRAHGFADFLVDTSGELYAGGRGCQGRPWRVGVNDPRDPLRSTLVEAVFLENMSVTTSGSYEHFYTVAGKRYSHVISPVTGFPRDEIVSATVIAPGTEFSDFLSTALCLMPVKKGIALVDALGEGYAAMVLVDEGGGKLARKASRYYKKYLSR
ncbi:MAG: FAD:protein FMN transferase [Candidatus Omnitrophica bacterium]|nr:FAD:protein FMN transferase [Candidatus Omnitrophota bacterium]